MKDFVRTDDDNGGVHINSGIPNHAFYRVATALGGHAWEKAGRIWYIALCDRLRRGAHFRTAASTTVAVAEELFATVAGKRARSGAAGNPWVSRSPRRPGGGPRPSSPAPPPVEQLRLELRHD
jgi:hypothetical protein